MDTRQLETLLAVIDHGSFARAARKVNLTASAVSQQIAALEDELGATIFDRSHRPPRLTTRGQDMVRSARAILQIVSEAKSSGTPMRGTLGIGTLRTAAVRQVPRAVAELHARFPDLTVHLRVGVSEELMDAVSAGQLDMALVAEHVAVPTGLRWTEVIVETLMILAPARAAALTTDEILRTVPYIRYRADVPLARQIDTEMARIGIVPREVVRANTVTAILGCVHAGLGFAIVPHRTVLTEGPLVIRPFGLPDAGAEVRRRLGIAWRPDSPRAADIREVIETLQRQNNAP